MQVHTFRTAGVAHLSDDLSSGDVLSDLDIRRNIQMHVHGPDAVVMVDDTEVAHIILIAYAVNNT